MFLFTSFHEHHIFVSLIIPITIDLHESMIRRENEFDGLVIEVWSQLGGQARYFS